MNANGNRTDKFLKGVHVVPEHEFWVHALNVARAELIEWQKDYAAYEFYNRRGEWREPELVDDGKGNMVKRGPGVIRFANGDFIMKVEITKTIERLEAMVAFLSMKEVATRPTLVEKIIRLLPF